MSYFQHTKKDLADAKKEMGEALLALVHDSAAKADADEGFDTGYLLEDLMGRVVELAKGTGADVTLFPETAGKYDNHVYAYPIAVEGETSEADTYAGYPIHGFVPRTVDRRGCGALIVSTFNMIGQPVVCGRPVSHPIHGGKK